MDKMDKKKTIINFIHLLEEVQEGKDKGKHNNCVFINTLYNVRDIAVLNGINPESLEVRESWKTFFQEGKKLPRSWYTQGWEL